MKDDLDGLLKEMKKFVDENSQEVKNVFVGRVGQETLAKIKAAEEKYDQLEKSFMRRMKSLAKLIADQADAEFKESFDKAKEEIDILIQQVCEELGIKGYDITICKKNGNVYAEMSKVTKSEKESAKFQVIKGGMLQ